MNVSKDRDVKITEHSDDLKAVERINKGKYSKSNDRWKDYLDFELEISSSSRRKYTVAVIHSPAGEANEAMKFPFDERALENCLKDLQIAILSSCVMGGRLISSPEEKVIKDSL